MKNLLTAWIATSLGIAGLCFLGGVDLVQLFDLVSFLGLIFFTVCMLTAKHGIIASIKIVFLFSLNSSFKHNKQINELLIALIAGALIVSLTALIILTNQSIKEIDVSKGYSILPLPLLYAILLHFNFYKPISKF